MSEEIKTTAAEEIVEAKTEEAAEIAEAKPAETSVSKPAAPKPAEKDSKKKSRAVKAVGVVIGVVLFVAILAAIAAAVLLGMATKDDMPAAPTASASDMNTFVAGAVQEVLKDNTITVDSSDVDMILNEVKASVNGSTDMLEIKELFCVLANGKGTIYSRVYVDELDIQGHNIKLNKTLPVQVGFGIDFDDETKEIIVILEDIRCGAIKIPQGIVDSVLSKIQLPEEMRVKNGNIYYNTANLDAQIDEMVAGLISSYIKESSVANFLGGLLGEDTANGLIDSITDGVSNVAANVTDVQITGAHIDDNKLIIDGQVI